MRAHTAQARKRRRLGIETTKEVRDEFVRDQLLIVNWIKKKKLAGQVLNTDR